MGPQSHQWQTFLDTPPDEHIYEDSRFVVLPVPYDGTASFRTGARYGPAAIIDASRHLEDYDVELEIDASSPGIFTLPEIAPEVAGPKAVVDQVGRAVRSIVDDAKTPIVLGGEHTVAIGAVQACSDRFDDLSVLYLDAHADLRCSYMGSRWGHATVARRMSEVCPVVLVGVRSMSADERSYASEARIQIHTWPPEVGQSELFDAVSTDLTSNVYISIDLDVFDPSLMSAVGTPEPGGMSWWNVLALIRNVASRATIVGFDVVELSPEEGPVACSSTAARLVYKVIGYIVAGDD